MSDSNNSTETASDVDERWSDAKHPQMVEDFGEDPYYYLDAGTPSMAIVRIRMIDDEHLLRAYRGVENRYFGGRPGILREIDNRLAAIADDQTA